MKNKTVKNVKKRRIRFDRILIFLFVVLLIISGFIFLFNLKISNIYVINNNLLKDQIIIEMAGIEDYPSSIKNPSFLIENKLKENILIKDVKVYKKKFTKVYIEIVENEPLFYYEHTGKIILEDGSEFSNIYSVPTVINYITDVYYDEFIKEMSNLDKNILNMISEIKFYPNEVDDNRFLLTMSDGNLIYVNIATFNKLNKYLSIKESLPNKNGILYLDYGNNFEIIK